MRADVRRVSTNRVATNMARGVGLAIAIAGAGAAGLARDWPQWRGPDRDGISTETGLLAAWPDGGPKLLWEADGFGKGMASVAVSDGKLYTLGLLKGKTHLVCASAADGAVAWTAEVGPGNPNCTPTIAAGRVYSLGREGDFVCSDAETGRELWRKSFPTDFGGQMMSGWGYSESPLVDGDRVICTPGAADAMIVALDARTGEPVWKAAAPADWGGQRGKDGAGYSSIVVSRAGGVKQYVQLTGRGIVSVAADDGRVLWTYNRVANGTANIPTPIVKGDNVFCSSGYGTGAALLKIVPEAGGLRPEEVYFLEAKDLQNHHGGMILVGDHVYCGHGHNNGFPMCVDMLSGRRLWKEQRGAGTGSAAVAYADGRLYFRYESGEMALVEADPAEYRLVSQFTLASVKGKSWPHPVIADGRLYIRDQDALLCYDIRR
jgi:outer membrane protein assembly factor BamB